MGITHLGNYTLILYRNIADAIDERFTRLKPLMLKLFIL